MTEKVKDWHEIASKQSFLLGQISGMVHTMVDLPIDQLREHVDQLHNFLLDKLGKLYYKDDQ